MKKIAAIAIRELGSYFKSPVAYITLVVTFAVFNTFFYVLVEENGEATLRDMFKLMEFMFVFIVPLLTMRVFAEEKRLGTMEFLMTSPVSNTQIVLGKYFGSLIFFSVIIACSGIYYIIMECFSQPDRAATATGYLGMWVEGALFIAVGLLMSSLTKNQIIAAITTYMTVLLLYFSVSFVKYFSPQMQEFIKYISFWSHAESLAGGLIQTSDLIYYLSGIAFCLALTRIAIENRLWK